MRVEEFWPSGDPQLESAFSLPQPASRVERLTDARLHTAEIPLGTDEKNGRGERIRTSDSCVPNAVLYLAELHPDCNNSTCDQLRENGAWFARG